MDDFWPYLAQVGSIAGAVWYFRSSMEAMKDKVIKEVEERFTRREDFRVLENEVKNIQNTLNRIETMVEKIATKI